MNQVVVTRHSALVEFLQETGVVGENVQVIEHATPEAITGKDVIGVLPLHLAALTNTVTAVAVNVPPEMRGQELTLEDMRKYASKPETYKVSKV